MFQPRRSEPDSERQVAAQADRLGDHAVMGRRPGRRAETDEQVSGFGWRQHVEVDRCRFQRG